MAFLVSRWACASCGASFEDKSEAEACERYHVIQGSLALDRISLKNENLTDEKIAELNELFRRTRIVAQNQFDPEGVVNSYERGLADAQIGRSFPGNLADDPEYTAGYALGAPFYRSPYSDEEHDEDDA